MIAIPAVDLRGGRCVQLVGGRPEEERISLPDPTTVAEEWARKGFGSLHVVDLDAALGSGGNADLVRKLCGGGADVQAGGGLRDEGAVRAVLDAGAARAIVGTRAVEDRPWLEATAEAHPDRLVVAADIREGRVLSRGWREPSPFEVREFVAGLEGLPLAGVLCTDVGREGRMDGIDVDAMREIVDASPHPIQVSGGITTTADLEALERAGAAGAVLGMALYTGTLDAAAVAARYGTQNGASGPEERG